MASNSESGKVTIPANTTEKTVTFSNSFQNSPVINIFNHQPDNIYLTGITATQFTINKSVPSNEADEVHYIALERSWLCQKIF